MMKLLNGPKLTTNWWSYCAWIAAAVAVCVFVAMLTPRLLGLYWLYWGNTTFKEIFRDDVGLSEGWASTLGLVVAFFYALAMTHLVGRSAWQYLAGKADARELAMLFAAYLFVLVAPHAIRAMAGSNHCFNGVGEPTKWFVETAGGQIIFYDTPGYDKFGVKKQPVTGSICETFHRLRTGGRPRKITADPRTIEFFNPITQAPIVWYSKSAIGFTLYDARGFDPGTSEPLKPVTPEVADESRSRAEKDEQRRIAEEKRPIEEALNLPQPAPKKETGGAVVDGSGTTGAIVKKKTDRLAVDGSKSTVSVYSPVLANVDSRP